MGKPEQKTEKERLYEERHTCLVCGTPGPDTICKHCKIVVQAEAMNEKRKIEKQGGGPK